MALHNLVPTLLFSFSITLALDLNFVFCARHAGLFSQLFSSFCQRAFVPAGSLPGLFFFPLAAHLIPISPSELRSSLTPLGS